MNYQLSLDAGGNLPTLEDSEEEDDVFASLQSLIETSDSVSDLEAFVWQRLIEQASLQEPKDSIAETATALVPRGASEVSSIDWPAKGKSGFEKIKVSDLHAFSNPSVTVRCLGSPIKSGPPRTPDTGWGS